MYIIILTDGYIAGIGRRTNEENVNKDHHRNGSVCGANVVRFARLDLRVDFGYVKLGKCHHLTS